MLFDTPGGQRYINDFLNVGSAFLFKTSRFSVMRYSNRAAPLAFVSELPQIGFATDNRLKT